MEQLILILHVLASIGIISLVLLQHGKGADAGATFGGGASGTMFGSAGSLPFLMKVTATLAAVFFITSISLGYLISRVQPQNTLMNTQSPANLTVPTTQTETVPSGSVVLQRKSDEDKKQ